MIKYNDYHIVFENKEEIEEYFSYQKYLGLCDKITDTPLQKENIDHFPIYLVVKPTYLEYDYKWVEEPINNLIKLLTNEIYELFSLLNKVNKLSLT